MPWEDEGDADRDESMVSSNTGICDKFVNALTGCRPAVSGLIDHFSSLRTSRAVDVCNRLPDEILAGIFTLLGKATIGTDPGIPHESPVCMFAVDDTPS